MFDSFTDVGLPAAATAPGGASEGGGGGRRAAPTWRNLTGPADRPGTTQLRSEADEVSWKRTNASRPGEMAGSPRSCPPKGGMFPGKRQLLDMGPAIVPVN